MLYEIFSKNLQELSSHRRYLLALSGGLDSCVLLHLLTRFAAENTCVNIRVIHIHHGLSPNADAWQDFCATQCEKYHLPFRVEKVQLDLNSKKGLEAEARSKRYQAFLKNIQENEVLLTAHTQSDQAETVLLQLFRGAGAKGLSAMPMKKLIQGYEHLRPLLNCSRENLHDYATAHQLRWIEDESNLDQRFDRNFLRHAIFPILNKRWFNASQQLSKAASTFSESAELLENLADLDLAPALSEFPNQLKIEPLLMLSLLRQQNALRRFFQKNNSLMPDRKRLSQIMETIFRSPSDKNPCIAWKDIELHRYQGQLFLIPRLWPFDANSILPWNFKEPLVLPAELGIVQVEKKIGEGIRADLDGEKISVRFRKGGEVIRWHQQTQVLKKLFQAWKIPPWERARIPCIFYGEELIAIPGRAIADAYHAPPGMPGYFLHLKPVSLSLSARSC